MQSLHRCDGLFISGNCQKKSEFHFLLKNLAHRVHFISWHRDHLWLIYINNNALLHYTLIHDSNNSWYGDHMRHNLSLFCCSAQMIYNEHMDIFILIKMINDRSLLMRMCEIGCLVMWRQIQVLFHHFNHTSETVNTLFPPTRP